MIEPREREWGGYADWTKLPVIEPRVPALLERCRGEYADRELIVFDDRRTTYGELEARSATLARRLLEAGIGKGCRVGVMLPSDETFLVTWMAVTRIGAVAVTLSTLLTAPELAGVARHADLHLFVGCDRYLNHDYVARFEEAFPGLAQATPPYRLATAPYLRGVWLWGERIPAWARAVEAGAEPEVARELLAAVESEIHSSDPAGIIYTSGSTAEPKGVIHSHGNFMRQSAKLAATYDLLPDERFFASMPFFWVGGITVSVLPIMQLGATLLASSRTGTALLDFLERERTTHVMTWFHILRGMAADPTFAKRDWSAMRSGLLYEALPPAKRPKDPTLMGMSLGMTESSGPYTLSLKELPENQRGSVGPPMPGSGVRIFDTEKGAVLPEGGVGMIQIRTDAMLLGMVKRERADVVDADGWYSTGDLGSFKEGFLQFHGRADDMIKASGANVSPREVEVVLAKIAGVANVNVSGVPDRARGNVVGAVIVPAPGASLDAEAIRREAAKGLSSFKLPRVIVFLDASKVPMMSSTKVDRRALVRLLAEAHEKAATS